MFCKHCGIKIAGNFCVGCGQASETAGLKKPSTNKKYPIIMVIFPMLIIFLLVVIVFQNMNRADRPESAAVLRYAGSYPDDAGSITDIEMGSLPWSYAGQPRYDTLLVTPESYLGLEFYKELVINGRNAFSISPNGKYVLTVERANYDFIIFVYQITDYGRFSFLNSFSIRVDYVGGRLADDGSIVWSNNGESFAIGSIGGVLHVSVTYIFVYHITANRLINLTDSPYRVRSLTDVGDFFFDFLPAWSCDDGMIYFSRFGLNKTSGIFSVSSEGGPVSLVKGFDETSTFEFPALFAEGVVFITSFTFGLQAVWM